MSEDPASTSRLPQIAILFSQFAGYHVDRVEAAAKRLNGRAEVLAVEYATTSETYAWERPGEVAYARHVTLFPGRSYETLGAWEKYRAAKKTLAQADMVCVGVPYSERDIIALSWRLAAAGKPMVMMTDSKFDDKPRSVVKEAAKARLLKPYTAAIVAGVRQREYVRFLGFEGKPVMPGYDTIDLDRVRQAAGSEAVRWEDRDFLYVGRFVEKKNLPTLLEGYARYRKLAGAAARGLVLAGDGELADNLKAQAGEGVSFTGFLKADDVANAMARALALCLVSTEEQWGLVVNEASALGIPSIVSSPVGARDALVRNGVTGHVVDPHSPDEIARAMLAMSQSEQAWQRYSEATATRAPLGGVEHFADAVEALFDPASGAVDNCEALWSAMEEG